MRVSVEQRLHSRRSYNKKRSVLAIDESFESIDVVGSVSLFDIAS